MTKWDKDAEAARVTLTGDAAVTAEKRSLISGDLSVYCSFA